MRTSLNNTKAIDDYIFGQLLPEDSVMFQAKMLLDDSLADDVNMQRKTHALLIQYGRQCLKQEIATAQKTFVRQNKTLFQRIYSLFI